jgi:hypothetical protein
LMVNSRFGLERPAGQPGSLASHPERRIGPTSRRLFRLRRLSRIQAKS